MLLFLLLCVIVVVATRTHAEMQELMDVIMHDQDEGLRCLRSWFPLLRCCCGGGGGCGGFAVGLLWRWS